MRRWFGVALLGLVGAVVGFLGFRAVNSQDDPGGVVAALGAVFLLLEVAGLVAVLTGLVGAGVAAVRSPRN